MTRRESSLALFFLFFLSVFSFFSFIWHLLWLVTSRFNYRRLGFGVFKVGRAADSNLNFPIISLFSDSLTPFVPYYSSKSPPLQRLESSNSLSFFSPSFLPFFLSLFLPSFLSLSLSLLPIHCIQSPRYSSNPQGYRNRGEKERERKKERERERENSTVHQKCPSGQSFPSICRLEITFETLFRICGSKIKPVDIHNPTERLRHRNQRRAKQR